MSFHRSAWGSMHISVIMYVLFLLDFILVIFWGGTATNTNQEIIEIRRELEANDVENDVEFLLWTPQNKNLPSQLILGNTSTLIHFKPELKTKILIHGYEDTGTTGWIINVKNAYFQQEDCNVISVDWRKLANTYPFYNVAAANTKAVGYLTASLVEFLIEKGSSDMSLFHYIGFSLGAQVAGHSGYKLQGRLPRITGLDPAGLLFHTAPPSERLDPSDAVFVDILHSAGLWIGMDEVVGHVDFYPNQGHHPQPGCENEGLGLDCSHQRAHMLWAESITSKTGFLAFQCDSWSSYATGECDLSTVQTNLMGQPANPEKPGVYYLRTYAKSPFAIPQAYLGY